MTDDMHDDGLVHAHDWAREPPPPVGELLRRDRPSGAVHSTELAAAMAVKQGGDHDDGLVHSHGWACGERGRMAQA